MASAMMLSQLLLQNNEYQQLKAILAKTQKDLGADLVLLIDRAGHEIASDGQGLNFDNTALASLAAANLAATQELARMVGETEFSIIYHQGRHRSIHISDVARKYSLVLIFEDSVSMGMVRWKVKRAATLLGEILEDSREHKPAREPGASAAPSFTDAEIERLMRHLSPIADVEGKV